MGKPDWFTLIQEWRPKQMGEYGITLPFLVGALGYKSGECSLSKQHIRSALDDIINKPVEGYVTEVRWCGNINAPVFTVRENSSQSNVMPFQSYFPRPNCEEASLGFSADLQSRYGLNCKDQDSCYEKLINYAAEYVEKGCYSRNWSESEGKHVYGGFVEKELNYIRETIMGS